jgi:Na+-driven multidrug efflux pump
MAAMGATALVAIAETVYVGALGTAALAGMALVFPMVMLQQMMSAGAMGGGVSSAISRALGAGDGLRAQALAWHALVIGAVAGLTFLVLLLGLGPLIYSTLGGEGAALAEALAYSNLFAFAAVTIWLANTLASIVRGTGNMKIPSATFFAVAALQIAIGGSLGLGLGPLPRLGMAGVALGPTLAFAAGALFLLWFLRSGRAAITLRFAGIAPRRDMFHDILKVGGVACLSSVQIVLTALIVTRLIAGFGTAALAGYGIGARLEFLMTPTIFAIGVACVPLVGMAIGAGDVTRARRVAWTGAALAALIVGTIGAVVAILPDLWATLFTADPGVLDAARTYLRWAGPGYGFFGLGLCLYFAAQGSGRILGPVLAGTVRLALVAVAGAGLAMADAPAWAMYALVALAMAAYGIAMAAIVARTRWDKA